LSQDAATFALGRSAPDANLLTLLERKVKTGLAYPTLQADLLGDLSFFFGFGVEDARVEAAARSQHPPFEFMC
jgi:hypothetical protein